MPVPEDAPHHFHSATLIVGDQWLLTSWVEGRAAVRVGLLDLQAGSWRVLTGMRGMLRAAIPMPDGRTWLLDDYGLAEVDLATAKITRKLAAKIGKHNDYLLPSEDDSAVVGRLSSTMESVVSFSTMQVTSRRRRKPGVAPETPTLSTALRQAGVSRILQQDSDFILGATSERDTEPQRLLVLPRGDTLVLTAVEFPYGLGSAHFVSDGVIAAAPDGGQARALTALAGLRAVPNGSQPIGMLAASANQSASMILSTRARKNPPRTVLRDLRLEPGTQLSNVDARRLTLENCVAGRATEASARPRITHVHVTDLELQSSSVSGAVLEDVTIDGLRAAHSSGFVFGCELRRVSLRGRIRGLVLNSILDDADPQISARFAQWHSERLGDDEWMLDLTEASGDITIRGYPSRFIRRNPALHAVVSAQALRSHEWRSIPHGRSALRVALHELDRSDWDDVMLIADPHGTHAADDLRYIERLRAQGIADVE